MGGKYADEVVLKIRLRHGGLANWGRIQRPNRSRKFYLLWLDTSAPLSEIAGTLMHEAIHLFFWIFFRDAGIREKEEHDACEVVDRAGVRAVKHYLKGGS